MRQRCIEGSGSPDTNFGGFCNVVDVPENSCECFSQSSLHKHWNKDVSMYGAREEGVTGFVVTSGAKTFE